MTTQQQLVPGQFFRTPLLSAPERMIPEAGPCAPNTLVNLSQGSTVKFPLSKVENLDVIRGYLVKADIVWTFTEGSGETLTQSPLFPLNVFGPASLKMQAAYSTFDMPVWLALVMQQYRSFLAPKAFTSYLALGSNPFPGTYPGSLNFTNSTRFAPNELALVSGTQQTFSLFLEIPVAQYFDLYWDIDAQSGQALGAYPRAIVSPARMAATQRNVTPSIRFNPLVSISDCYDSPVAKAAADATSTATGTAALSWWRDGWVPTDNPLTEPPGYPWQYARMSLDVQPAGAVAPIVNLADDRAGQGQILSLVFATWDPALNGGNGGFTPPSAYEKMELNVGSTVQLYEDTPDTNQYRWASKHGTSLPYGMFGWDLALTDDGKITNERALNTLVQAGCQLIPTYVSGSKPSNSSTIYVGIESLQSVTT